MTHVEPAVRTADEVTHQRRWWSLAVLCLSVLLVIVDNTIVNVALPTLSRTLGASITELQWIVDSYTLLFAGLLLAGGGLGDRFGRKPLLQLGLVLFALTSLWAAAASSTGQLIAARAGMGVAAAIIYPATLALLSSIFTDRRERATAIGIWSAVSGAAVAIGPVSGGLLLRHYEWNSVFLINIPFVAIALGWGAWLLPNSREESPGRFDVIGALLSVCMISLLVWNIIEAPARGWLSWSTALCGVGVLVLVALFARWELRSPHPVLDVRDFGNLRISAAAAAIAMAFFALFGFVFLITQYFQAVRGYDTLRAGLATLPFAVVVAAFSPLAIALATRFGAKIVVGCGLFTMTAGFMVVTKVGVDTAYWGPVVIAMALMAAGLAIAGTPSTDAIMGALPAHRFGAGSAINDTAREVGGALGVAVLGSVMNSAYGGPIATRFTELGMPRAAVTAAKGSIEAALDIADRLPAPLGRTVASAIKLTFMDGLHSAVVTAGAATAVAGIAAICFLPGHDAGHDASSLLPDASDQDGAAVVDELAEPVG